MSVYLQHCEAKFRVQELRKKVFTVWDEHDGKCVGPREKVTQNKTK